MNDFTKHELEYLFEAIDSDIECFNEPEIAYSARDKLQSMIDNYCEHEKMEFDGDVYGYSCKKCEKQFTGQVVDADRHYNILCGKE